MPSCRGPLAHLVRAVCAVTAVIAFTFVPFLAGGYDPLAAPLSAMARVLGHAGLLFVPIGGLWLLTAARGTTASAPARWLMWATLIACALIALVLILIDFASAGVLLAAGTALIAESALLVSASAAGRVAYGAGDSSRRSSIAGCRAHPGAGVQLAVANPMTTAVRGRAVPNSAMLIAEIEQHRTQYGEYPESLIAGWGDYKPSVLRIERYHYERSGDAYNIVFEQPSLVLGTREFVVYNPRDELHMTSHARDRVQLRGSGLQANRGYYAVHALPQPRWRVFLFD